MDKKPNVNGFPSPKGNVHHENTVVRQGLKAPAEDFQKNTPEDHIDAFKHHEFRALVSKNRANDAMSEDAWNQHMDTHESHAKKADEHLKSSGLSSDERYDLIQQNKADMQKKPYSEWKSVGNEFESHPLDAKLDSAPKSRRQQIIDSSSSAPAVSSPKKRHLSVVKSLLKSYKDSGKWKVAGEVPPPKSEELKKGPYLRQGSKLGQELYDEVQNIERKKTRTGQEAQGAGIRAEQLWGGRAGYQTAKEQATAQAKVDRIKSKKNPVKTLADMSPEQIKALEEQYGVPLKRSEKPFRGYNKNRHARTGGLNDKAREKINREEGSNLKRPVTEKNPTGDRAARKKSFCARMSGVKGPTSKDGELTPKGAALKRWRCSKSLQEKFEKSMKDMEKRCWKGYEPVPGKKPFSEDSCRPIKKSQEHPHDDGPKMAMKFLEDMKNSIETLQNSFGDEDLPDWVDAKIAQAAQHLQEASSFTAFDQKNPEQPQPLNKPPKSEAQRRFMGAVASGKVKGVSPKVGKEYLKEDKGGKLPEKIEKKWQVAGEVPSLKKELFREKAEDAKRGAREKRYREFLAAQKKLTPNAQQRPKLPPPPQKMEKGEISAEKIGRGLIPDNLHPEHKSRLAREFREMYRRAKVKGDHEAAKHYENQAKKLSREAAKD